MTRTPASVAAFGLSSLLIALLAWAPLMPPTTPDAAAKSTHSGTCERGEGLREEQADVLRLLRDSETGRDLTQVDDERELAELAALGYNLYPHHQTSVAGIGWVVFNTFFEEPWKPGLPPLLSYRPTPPPPPLTVTDPRDGFDFPYTFTGWAYTPIQYDFQTHPDVLSGRCVKREDWFVHERMAHDDGGIDNRPPKEDDHGTSPGGLDDEPAFSDCLNFLTPTGDVCHPRVWDIHLWLRANANGRPRISILSPDPIPGVDPQVGTAFFYPCDGVHNVKHEHGTFSCR